jgi:signal transduction histidine kinase
MRMPGALLGGSESVVAGAIAATALRIERAISIARILFFGALLFRFFWYHRFTPDGALLTALPLALGIGFSVFVLAALRTPPRGERYWLLSVSLDALAAFSTLAPNALWPAPEYVGIANIPDTSGILLAIFGSGFRLSPRAALLGGTLNVASLLALVAVDHVVSGPSFYSSFETFSVYLIFAVSCTVLTVVLAVAVRRLVRQGAMVAVRADRAEQGLGALFAHHHDARALLTSAVIASEVMVEKLTAPSPQPDPRELARIAVDLRDDLLRIRAVVDTVRTTAERDIVSLGAPEPVDVAAVVARVAASTREVFSTVQVRVECDRDGTEAMVSGGEPTLSRILTNLFHNACEGDGHAHADQVRVKARADDDLAVVRIVVEDNGPGVGARVTTASSETTTTKPQGSGIGISVARGLCEASGGHLSLWSRDGHGAVATVTLPARAPRAEEPLGDGPLEREPQP